MRTRTVIGVIAPPTLLVTFGMLPAFLVSSLSVVVDPRIGLTDARIGILVGTNFFLAMLCSIPAGRLVQQWGARTGLRVGAALTTVGIAVVATSGSWRQFALGMAFTGSATAFLQVAANLTIAQRVPLARLGLAFSVKQSSIPGATLVAGLVLPILARRVPWQAVFVVLAILIVAILASQRGVSDQEKADAATTHARAVSVPLAVLALGISAASAAATSMAAFLVPFLVTIGQSADTAGAALTIGSTAAIAGRVVAGQVRDCWELDGFLIAVVQVVTGSVALMTFVLFSGSPVALNVAMVFAFAVGWAWSGVFTEAVVRARPRAAAMSTGVTQVGIYLGASVGPPVFGLIAETQGYGVAWRMGAALFLAAGSLTLGGRRLLQRASELPTRDSREESSA